MMSSVIAVLAQLGFAVVVGVPTDTFIIRGMLIPAVVAAQPLELVAEPCTARRAHRASRRQIKANEAPEIAGRCRAQRLMETSLDEPRQAVAGLLPKRDFPLARAGGIPGRFGG
jgi:hypothetical protein